MQRTTDRRPTSPPPGLKLLAHAQRWRLVRSLVTTDRRVSELVRAVKQAPNLVSYHLRQLRDDGLVRERRSSADARDVYYSLNLARLRSLLAETGDRLHPALGEAGEAQVPDLALPSGLRVLFLCTHNSARSQMAEGLLRSMSDGRVAAFSAGTEVTRVHPLAVRAMQAEGIDVTGQRSKHLDEFRDETFDYVITVCDRASESCPVFPGGPERIHWSIPDPSAVEGPGDKRYKAFQDAAIDLRTRIGYFLVLLGRPTGQVS